MVRSGSKFGKDTDIIAVLKFLMRPLLDVAISVEECAGVESKTTDGTDKAPAVLREDGLPSS